MAKSTSFLDIRARFQGFKTDKRGKKIMNSDSIDPEGRQQTAPN